MSERFLKYETTNKDLPVDERGVLTAAGGGSGYDYIIENVNITAYNFMEFSQLEYDVAFKFTKGDMESLVDEFIAGKIPKVLLKNTFLYGDISIVEYCPMVSGFGYESVDDHKKYASMFSMWNGKYVIMNIEFNPNPGQYSWCTVDVTSM